MSIEQKTFNTPNEHQVHLLTVDKLTKEKKKGKKKPPTGWWCTVMSNKCYEGWMVGTTSETHYTVYFLKRLKVEP